MRARDVIDIYTWLAKRWQVWVLAAMFGGYWWVLWWFERC